MESLENKIEIITPENVKLEFEVAGLGSRFMALLIDVTVILTVIGLLYWLIDYFEGVNYGKFSELNSVYITILLLMVFLIQYGYWVFFEMIFNGATIGKKIMNLTVIKKTGESINIIESIIRNLIRVVEFLPAFFFLGAVSILLSKKNQRIGDYAANTIVIRKSNQNETSLQELISQNKVEKFDNEYIIDEKLNYNLEENEFLIIKEFLEKRNSMLESKYFLETKLKDYFINKLNIENHEIDAFQLLNTLYMHNLKRFR
jgi:uncharacterized RDD family membrane protein YckC